MAQDNRRKFLSRSFVSYAILVLFVAVALSGLLLFFLPIRTLSGPTAFLGIPLSRWSDIHIVSSLLFIVFGIWHIVLNFKALVCYIRKGASCELTIKRDVVFAILLICLILTLTGLRVPPFSYIADFSRKVRSSSVSKPNEPTPSPSQDVNALNLTPASENEGPVICQGKEGCGRGEQTGRLTLAQFCELFGLDLNDSIEKLKAQGIEATPESFMRHLADKAGVFPYDMAIYLSK